MLSGEGKGRHASGGDDGPGTDGGCSRWRAPRRGRGGPWSGWRWWESQARDLHFFEGQNPYANYPQTQGHEFSGRVEAFGDGYQGPVRVGQRVSVEPPDSLRGVLPLRRGRPNCCTRLQVLGIHTAGAFAEYVTVPVGTLYPADDLDPDLTALAEPISIGMQVVTRGQVTGEDHVAVYGAGMIGQAVLACALDRGARVLLVDRIPSRLALGRRLGAERVVDGSQEDAVGAIREWTGGDGAAVRGGRHRGPGGDPGCGGRRGVLRAHRDRGHLPAGGVPAHPGVYAEGADHPGLAQQRRVFGAALDLVRRRGSPCAP